MQPPRHYSTPRSAARFVPTRVDRSMAVMMLPAALALGVQAQIATTSSLSVSGSDPYNLSCLVTGSAPTSNAGPTGSVTFFDVTANHALTVESLGAATQAPVFVPEELTPPGVFAIPPGVVALAAADFNSDGKLDLAILANNTVYIALGNGNSTFAVPANIAAISANGALPQAIVAGDFNGDGLMDVAIAYSVSGSSTLQVLLNQGNGTFQPQAPTTFPLPSTLSGIVAVDFSGNGVWGLVLGDANSGTVESIAGNSSGTLQAPVSYTVGSNTTGLVTGEFNGDNKTDVAVTTGNGVAVLLNGGNGTFGSPVETSLAYSSGQPVAGDYSGDGVLDLLVYNVAGAHLLKGNGDGSFQAPGSVVASQNGDMVGGDFNGDGKPDLAFETVDSLGHPNALAIYLGDGAGGLDLASSSQGYFELNDSLTGSADLTGDGRSDLLGLRGNGAGVNSAEIWLNSALEAVATAAAQSVPVVAGGSTTHNLTCAYGGDSNYAASTSPAVAVSIPAQSLSLTSTPTSQTITAGQSAGYVLTITPGGAYAGSVKLSCGALPSEVACNFSPAGVAITGGAAQSTLSIATTAATTSRNNLPASPFGRRLTALALLLALGLATGRMRRCSRRMLSFVCIALLAAISLSLVACNGGGSSTPANPGTPAGTYVVTVTAADTSGTPANSVQLTLVVQ